MLGRVIQKATGVFNHEVQTYWSSRKVRFYETNKARLGGIREEIEIAHVSCDVYDGEQQHAPADGLVESDTVNE